MMNRLLSSRIHIDTAHKLCRVLLSVFCLLISVSVSLAAEKKETDYALKVEKGSQSIALQRTIQVEVSGLDKWARQKGNDPSKFVLSIDGYPLKGLEPMLVHNGSRLQFKLKRISKINEDAWNSILSKKIHGFSFSRHVFVSVGHPDITVDGAYRTELVIVNQNWFYFFIVIFLAGILIFIWLAAKSDILRAPGAQPGSLDAGGKPSRKRYSLARTQMAVWLFTILISYVFIWMVTDDLTCLTPSVLGLMGISAMTGLGSAAVDSTKLGEKKNLKHMTEEKKRAAEAEVENLNGRLASFRKEEREFGKTEAHLQHMADLAGSLAVVRKEIEQAEEKIEDLGKAVTPPLSRSFLVDILSDDAGLSFHRFQMFAWTIVLVIIFVAEVYQELTMPDFDSTLLALMGISSGTYIGFKMPERQG
jgi:hypothetical protein